MSDSTSWRDTSRVLYNRTQIRVRLYGVDSPERRQALYERARQFTSDMAFGKAVIVRVQDTDRYGRTVGEVILPDGRNLNQELVKAGFAWWYRNYAKNDAMLRSLEEEARRAKRGLWADEEPVAALGISAGSSKDPLVA